MATIYPDDANDDQSSNTEWTCTNICINSTDVTLPIVSPVPAAIWYGKIDVQPISVPAKHNGYAGVFKGRQGSLTGVQAISVYVSEDPTKALFFLINISYSDNNEAKCGFIDVNSRVDAAQVERLYYDKQFGPSATHEFEKNGKKIVLYCDSEIEQGKYVTATFTLSYKT